MGMFWGSLLVVFIIMIILGAIGAKEQAERQAKYKPKLDAYIEENVHVTNVIRLKTIHRDYSIYVDEPNEKILYVDMLNCHSREFKFSQIVGYELREDGKSTNGVGRAVAGGLMFGETGAIVGAVTQKETVENVFAVLYLDNLAEPEWIIKLNEIKIKKNSSEYRQLINFSNQLSSTVKLIISRKEKKANYMSFIHCE